MDHNPLRSGVRNREDAVVVLRYFFWIICAVPIVEMIIWFLTIYANQGFILRPSSGVALLTLMAYIWFKQKRTERLIYVCIYVSLFYWLVRFYEDYMTSTSPIRPFANLIPVLLVPMFLKTANRVKEALKY